MSICLNTCIFTLPSISEIFSMESGHFNQLPELLLPEPAFTSTPKETIVQKIISHEDWFSEKEKSLKDLPTPVFKSSKMKKPPTKSFFTFDSKTLEEVTLIERSFYLGEGEEKPKWVFEENIFHKRGRKGKPKEWKTNIHKINHSNKK
jgi:hypothetical protein